MIAVRLMGGLGNQMFQYALGRTLADRHDVPLVLDTSRFVNRPVNEVPRDFELDCFAIRAEVTDDAVPASRWAVRRMLDTRRLRLVSEKGFRFQPEVLRAGDHTLLFGYWQSELYFVSNAPAIQKDFSPTAPPSERTLRLSESIDGNTVCIHVRRADYVTHPRSSAFHRLMPVDYYNRAIAHIVASAGITPRILVISDDPEWCVQHLALDYPMTVAELESGRNWEDLLLISLCRYIVVANSSFSWWGAWLSEASDKIVVAPSAWFRDATVDTRDLLPSQWTVI